MKTKLRLLIALAALAAAGCAGTSALSPKVDAADAESRFGDLVSRFDLPATGRDWNCKACYK